MDGHAYRMGPATGWHVVIALGNQANKICARVGPIQGLSLSLSSKWVRVHMATCLVCHVVSKSWVFFEVHLCVIE